ncbi:MAG: MarR family transcriptional regulator [bacterium]
MECVARAVADCGVVGELRNARLIYLALTSRVLKEPVSLVMKGCSSSGKSFTTETVLKLFPPAAYISMTAMSERALVYSKETFAHRTLVIFEAVALREQREKSESNLTAYFLRSLLSEGRISYPVTVRDKKEGFITKTIVKEGPTNVILTTTATELHGENETRLISVPTNDSQAQTAAVLLRLAEAPSVDINFAEWHKLQKWIGEAEHRVVIPYAKYVAARVPPVAVRLRRDFKAILRLIETHAILHQLNRERDSSGRIVAEAADYYAVRELLADLIAEGVGATVPPSVRETVDAIRALDVGEGVTVKGVAERLKLDRSATQRRLQTARERGYLVNQEDKRGRPARYTLGDALPDELELLPNALSEEGVQVCSDSEGIYMRAESWLDL